MTRSVVKVGRTKLLAPFDCAAVDKETFMWVVVSAGGVRGGREGVELVAY